MDPDLKAYLDDRFSSLNQRLDAMDRRFVAIEQRLDAIDHRFVAIEQRLDAMDHRFVAIDREFVAVRERIDAVQAGMFQRLDEMAATLEEHFREQQTEVLKAAFTMQEQINVRTKEQDNSMTAVRDRLAIVERRLFEIEKRLLMPPQ
jgi:predicted  nucleic acid-binding Zn-ribbon protein